MGAAIFLTALGSRTSSCATVCTKPTTIINNFKEPLGKGPTKTCRSTKITRTASGAIELLLKAAGTQGAQGTQT